MMNPETVIYPVQYDALRVLLGLPLSACIVNVCKDVSEHGSRTLLVEVLDQRWVWPNNTGGTT